jgi:DNA-binding response OmpR family regulator
MVLSFGLAGHDVSVANDAVSAANLAMDEPDVVLLDVVDSYDVGEMLRRILGDAPVIALSCRDDTERRRSCAIDLLIPKPSDDREVEDILCRLYQARILSRLAESRPEKEVARAATLTCAKTKRIGRTSRIL